MDQSDDSPPDFPTSPCVGRPIYADRKIFCRDRTTSGAQGTHLPSHRIRQCDWLYRGSRSGVCAAPPSGDVIKVRRGGFWPLWSTVVDTLRAPAGADCGHCCHASAESICSFTTAFTGTATSCSGSNMPVAVDPLAAPSWSIPSTSIPRSMRSPGPAPNIRHSSAPPNQRVETRGASAGKAYSVSFASNIRRTPTRSGRRDRRYTLHPTTAGVRTHAQPETIASISGAYKDAE